MARSSPVVETGTKAEKYRRDKVKKKSNVSLDTGFVLSLLTFAFHPLL